MFVFVSSLFSCDNHAVQCPVNPSPVEDTNVARDGLELGGISCTFYRTVVLGIWSLRIFKAAAQFS